MCVRENTRSFDAPRSLTGFFCYVSSLLSVFHITAATAAVVVVIRSVLMTPNGLIIFRGNHFMTRAMLDSQVIGPVFDHLLDPFSHLQTHTCAHARAKSTRPLETIESCEFIVVPSGWPRLLAPKITRSNRCSELSLNLLVFLL